MSKGSRNRSDTKQFRDNFDKIDWGKKQKPRGKKDAKEKRKEHWA